MPCKMQNKAASIFEKIPLLTFLRLKLSAKESEQIKLYYLQKDHKRSGNTL